MITEDLKKYSIMEDHIKKDMSELPDPETCSICEEFENYKSKATFSDGDYFYKICKIENNAHLRHEIKNMKAHYLLNNTNNMLLNSHIVKLEDVYCWKNNKSQIYFLEKLEKIEGNTFQHHIEIEKNLKSGENKFDFNTKLDIYQKLCKVMELLYSEYGKNFHTDIRPENCIITKKTIDGIDDFDVKLIDMDHTLGTDPYNTPIELLHSLNGLKYDSDPRKRDLFGLKMIFLEFFSEKCYYAETNWKDDDTKEKERAKKYKNNDYAFLIERYQRIFSKGKTDLSEFGRNQIKNILKAEDYKELKNVLKNEANYISSIIIANGIGILFAFLVTWMFKSYILKSFLENPEINESIKEFFRAGIIDYVGLAFIPLFALTTYYGNKKMKNKINSSLDIKQIDWKGLCLSSILSLTFFSVVVFFKSILSLVVMLLILFAGLIFTGYYYERKFNEEWEDRINDIFHGAYTFLLSFSAWSLLLIYLLFGNFGFDGVDDFGKLENYLKIGEYLDSNNVVDYYYDLDTNLITSASVNFVNYNSLDSTVEYKLFKKYTVKSNLLKKEFNKLFLEDYRKNYSEDYNSLMDTIFIKNHISNDSVNNYIEYILKNKLIRIKD